MSVAEHLERELPYLRRYARAVTGSGRQGDAVVEAVLTRLVSDGVDEFERITVFRRLDQELAALSPGSTNPGIPALSSNPRRALLLTAMEGFTLADAADIMRQDLAGVRSDIAAAETSLNASRSTDVFIIEDEPLVAAHIAQIASEMGHRVIGQANTRESAVSSCRIRMPGLLLADVQLADGSSGIDAVADIVTDPAFPVVFITAYPQRLLSGEHGEPAFLIPKPFRPNMVKAVISQALIQA